MSPPSSTPASPEDPLIDPRPIHRGEGPLGVLLLHGLTGTPYDVQPFADALARAGFAVRAPQLAGHADLETLESSSWRDWYATAEAAFDALLDRDPGQGHGHGHERDGGPRRVMVLGFSLGSLLALRLAALRTSDVTALVALSVPLSLPAWQRRGIGALARLRTVPGLGRLIGMVPAEAPDVRIEQQSRASPSLRAFPFPALAELIALQDEVADLLPHVRAPLLLMHGRLDHNAPLAMSDRVAQRVGSEQVHRVVLPRSFHILAHDLDRDRACQEIVRFARSTLGIPAPADVPSTASTPSDGEPTS